jgi:uncharacterized integral membrane protein
VELRTRPALKAHSTSLDWRSVLKPKVVVLLVIALLALLVIAQNAQYVNFRFLFWSVMTTQIFLIVLMIAFGFLMGFLVGKLTGRGKK